MSERSARVLETRLQEDMPLWVLLYQGQQLCVLQAAALCNAREGSMNRENCPVEQLLHRAAPGLWGFSPHLTRWEDEKKWLAL